MFLIEALCQFSTTLHVHMNGIAGDVKGGRAVWLAAHAGYLVNLQISQWVSLELKISASTR